MCLSGPGMTLNNFRMESLIQLDTIALDSPAILFKIVLYILLQKSTILTNSMHRLI